MSQINIIDKDGPNSKNELPDEFEKRMRDMLGAEYHDFVQSLEGERFRALRMNPLKKADDAKVRIKREFNLTQVSWEHDGYYYTEDVQPGKHPCHDAGLYYIQEPSAMAAAPLAEAAPGERILDLCAAPGGKSTQLAGYMAGQGLLVCNEIHPARAKILSENIERMGIANACVTNETVTRLSEKFPEYFDKILVDAPCSGEGMFRKNETACDEWSPENVRLCAERQDMILDCAARMLRPGGRIVYSTCTFSPDENEGSVWRFVERHPEFTIIPIDKRTMGLPEGVCDGRPEWADYGTEIFHDVHADVINRKVNQDLKTQLKGTLRLWPQHIRGEGHFAAILQKEGFVPEGYMPQAVGGTERGISPDARELAEWRNFCNEMQYDFTEILSGGIFLRFGDNLYLAPENMPSLKGIKVLRPGLHLGTFKKNRFEPSHALALAVSAHKLRHICHLSAQDERTVAYLNGQTFPYEGEKGWYLIAVDGCGIGWGKMAGAMMKNHYPKGLRKN